VDEKALPGSELERRDSLVALLFRLEAGPDPEDLIQLIGEIIGWFRQHPDYETLKQLFTEVVGHVLSMQNDAATVPVPLPANDMMEILEMVPERFRRWADEVKAKTLAEYQAQVLAETRGKTLAEVLSRQLRRRFGELEPEIVEKIAAAKVEELDEWTDRVIDAASLEEVFGGTRPN